MERPSIDELWKDAVEGFFEDFLGFFIPYLKEAIDFSKGYVPLEKELSQIAPESNKGKSIPDKLIRVWLKDGTEKYILVHIEVQGYQDNEFALRMFRYYYRIYDKYGLDVIAIALLTDKYPDYKPDCYSKSLYGTEIRYAYNTFKLLDMKGQENTLESSDNPFSLAVMSGIYAIEASSDDDKKYSFKIKLLRNLIHKKWGSQKIYALFCFFDGLLRLSEEKEMEFKNEMRKITEEVDGMSSLTFERSNLAEAIRYEARLAEKYQVAREALLEGLEPERIVKLTKLTIDEIRKLQEETSKE